jgi:hypothetical protein
MSLLESEEGLFVAIESRRQGFAAWPQENRAKSVSAIAIEEKSLG